MADAADFVLAVYNEHMAQARWHEEQREKVSSPRFCRQQCVAYAWG